MRDLHKSYGPADVIKGTSLDVLEREFVMFLIPFGRGKSTLCACLRAWFDLAT